jgi:hypothetical protein
VLRSGIEAKGSLITTALRRNLLGLFPMYRINADATTFDHVMGMLLFVGIVAVFALALLWIVFSNRKPAVDIKRNARALLVVPLPYLWFAVMSNHSAVHYWFSYRIQAIALFPILFFVASSLDSSRLRARILRLGQRIALPAKSDTLAP